MTATRHSAVINQANYEEPEEKAPPMLVTGPLAWVRQNLFSSTFDAVLTVLGIIVIIGVVYSFLDWSVNSANWFVIIFNLRLFMVGRIENFLEWRILFLTLFIAVIVGVNLASWTRVTPRIWITLIVVMILLFLVPMLVQATVALPPLYLASGQSEITFGSVSETPPGQIGFIARAGESVTVRLASAQTSNDDTLSQLSGFAGRAVDAVRNGAANRLSAQARIQEINALLAEDTLTPRQREAVEAELEDLTVPDPIVESYQINQEMVQVSILDGESLEVLAEASLGTGEDELVFEVPGDGWYVLEKSIPGSDTSVAILEVSGVSPLLDRNYLSTEETEEGSFTSERIFEYRRVTDGWVLVGNRPRIDGDDVFFVSLLENQYRGTRLVDDYLSLVLAQFLGQVNLAYALLVIFTMLGYFGSRFVDQRFAPPDKPRQYSRRAAIWLWVALPVVAFILIAGIFDQGLLQFSDPQFWGGLLLTMMLTAVGIVAAFPLGIGLALGRRSNLPIVSFFSTAYIELVRGVPLITVLFMSMLLVPFVVPSLGGPDSAPYRAMVAVTLFSAAYLAENVRGGLQSLPPGQEEAAKALGLSPWQVTMNITLPQALRAVIPALVGQFISLYKDTSLVAIVGLIDLTGVANNVAAQSEFQGLRREPYVFISAIYFVFCYIMSVVSRRIEASGSGAARRA